MISATVEVIDGFARFDVRLRAASLTRALALAKRIYPGAECAVKFPIEPETFFVPDGCECVAGPIRSWG